MCRILTIKETATISGLSEYAIRTGIKQGKIPACRLTGGNGKYLVDFDAFETAIRNQCNYNLKLDSNYDGNNNVINIESKIRKVQV